MAVQLTVLNASNHSRLKNKVSVRPEGIVDKLLYKDIDCVKFRMANKNTA